MSNGPARDLGDLLVMVVDPNRARLARTTSILNRMGFANVRARVDSEGAFRAMQCVDPDLLIADWRMSPLGGLKLTELVRARADRPGRRLPIILLTALDPEMALPAARQAGADAVLRKPLSSLRLSPVVQALFGAAVPAGALP